MGKNSRVLGGRENRLQCTQIPALSFRGGREKQAALQGKHQRLVCHSRRSDGACDKMGEEDRRWAGLSSERRRLGGLQGVQGEWNEAEGKLGREGRARGHRVQRRAALLTWC